MILYFSATGNSRWVAQQLAALTGDVLCNIADCLKEGCLPALPDGTERVGVVFPIHSWYVPAPVLDFLMKLHVPASAYRYAVCTCGDDVGKGMSRLAGHFPLDAAWSVQMPNTYVPMFPLDAPEVARKKVQEAHDRLPRIAKAVEAKERVWEVHEGGCPWLKTYVVQPLFVHCYIGIKAFRVDDSCISCGLCEEHCPVSAVRLSGGRPVWSDACIHCMACLHGCPAKAIQYGKGTRKKGRYRLDDYLPSFPSCDESRPCRSDMP